MVDITYNTPHGAKKNLLDMGDGTHVEGVSFVSPVRNEAVVIDAAASLSDEIDCGDLRLFRVGCPAAIPSAASLTFLGYNAALDKWNSIYDGDTELTYTLGADKDINVDRTIFASYDKIKLRSGTKATPVNQDTALTLGLIFRSI